MLDLYLKLMAYVKREEGQDLVEYALILGLIAVAATAIIIVVGGNVEAIWTAVGGAVQDAADAVGP